MIPDLNRLRIFQYVYRLKSVSKAARELNLTQPAVSQHIKKLELELRIPLFSRLKRRLIPTPAATRLYEQTTTLLSHLEEEVKYLRRPLDTPYGLVRLGAPPSLGEQFLPSFCASFRFRYPTVSFELTIKETPGLLELLSDNRLDFALVSERTGTGEKVAINGSLFELKPLMQEHWHLAGTPAFLKRKRVLRHDFEQLKSLELVSGPDEGMALRGWFRHHFGKSPAELNVTLTACTQQAMLNAVRAGLGAAVLPTSLIGAEINAATMQVLTSRRSAMSNRISACRIRQNKQGLTENAFLTLLEKELATDSFIRSA